MATPARALPADNSGAGRALPALSSLTKGCAAQMGFGLTAALEPTANLRTNRAIVAGALIMIALSGGKWWKRSGARRGGRAGLHRQTGRRPRQPRLPQVRLSATATFPKKGFDAVVFAIRQIHTHILHANAAHGQARGEGSRTWTGRAANSHMDLTPERENFTTTSTNSL